MTAMRHRIRLATAALAVSATLACGGVEDELLAALRTEEQRAMCVGPQVLGVDAFDWDIDTDDEGYTQLIEVEVSRWLYPPSTSVAQD